MSRAFASICNPARNRCALTSDPGADMQMSVYGSRLLKRRKRRRSQAEIAELLSAVQSIVDGEEYAITVRHLFYRLVGLRVIPKTENAYKALVKHLAHWRRSGEVPWDAFADSTRWYIFANKPSTERLTPCSAAKKHTGATCGATSRTTASCGWRRTPSRRSLLMSPKNLTCRSWSVADSPACRVSTLPRKFSKRRKPTGSA